MGLVKHLVASKLCILQFKDAVCKGKIVHMGAIEILVAFHCHLRCVVPCVHSPILAKPCATETLLQLH